MFKGSSINLINANVSDKLSAGRIELPKGKAMRGLRMKVTCGILNTRSSSDTTPLTSTQKRDLLANLQFGVRHGHQQQHQPFKAFGGHRARLLQRYCYGSEMEGWSNSTTGLARTLPNGGTSTVVFYLTIPTGAFYQHKGRRRDFGLGPVYDVSLAEARAAAMDIRKMIRAGFDPVEQRALKRPTRAGHQRSRSSRASATSRCGRDGRIAATPPGSPASRTTFSR